MNEPNMNDIVGKMNLVFLTLDTLRYDVAKRLFDEGRTPNFAGLFPQGWEQRHTPGTFTLAAHQAFFAGFLPTPAKPGRHPRLFAARFEGSETTSPNTAVFDEATWIEGLAAQGYETICIGGVGFFNQRNALGRVLPSYFSQAFWSESLGVTCPESTENQFRLAAEKMRAAGTKPTLLFINISALHQPNLSYLDGAIEDSIETHAAALEYVDSQLPILLESLPGPQTFFIVCSDHGTAYGEEGFEGHRLAHQSVTHVPYQHGIYRKPQ